VFDERRFRAQMVLSGMSMKVLADILGLNESTLYRKIKADGAFTREEINKMIDVLNISDPKSIFFTDELASTQVTQ